MNHIYQKIISKIPLLVLLVLLSTLPTQAGNWLYMETQHFNIIYHPEVRDQALQVAQVAEEVFPELSDFTGFAPYRKIAIIVSGYDDIANGWAQPKDVAKIWINPLYTSTRVDQEWLKNVVTHELTHVLQMEATFGVTHKTHQLTGVSSVIGIPPNTYYPGWYLEGVAQYGATRQGYDALDRKRLMVMEQKIQSDSFYTDAELHWMRSPLAGEAFYNFGFGFFEYLMRTYGEEKFLQMQETHNTYYLLGQQNTLRIVYGKSLDELVAEWKAELAERFPVRIDREIAQHLADKPELSNWQQPQVTNSNGVIFLEQNGNRIAQKIQHWRSEGGLTTLLEDPSLVFSRISLSEDDQKLLYTKYALQDNNIIFDLYELDTATGQSVALTHNERIMMGVHFQKGYLVVKNDWGKTRLYLLENGRLTQLTDTDYNFNITDLKVSPDEQWAAVNFNYNGNRGIGIVNTQTWQYEKVYSAPEGEDLILGDFVDPEHLTFSWDRLEHYDLYQLNFRTGVTQQLTNTREDLLYGVARGMQWYGQIYSSEGFTLAAGSIQPQETIRLTATVADFAPAPRVKLYPRSQGNYSHYEQLRKDILIPYVSETEVGITQLWSDPLMELQVLYDLNLNMAETLPQLNLQAVWTGSQPNLSILLNANEKEIGLEMAQLFNLHPWYISLTESMSYAAVPEIDKLQLDLIKVWQSKNPGQTRLQTSYYPATLEAPAGYGVQLQHRQSSSVGYNGDSISSNLLVGLTGGSKQLAWGQNTSLFWVEPETRLAQGLVVEELRYQHNLIDLSANFADIYQTGRLYLNLFGQVGIFSQEETLTPASMVGAGLQLEGKIIHLLPSGMEIKVGINPAGDWKVDYNFATPF